jgi:uncharacterized protein (DUF2267 family)
MDELVTMVAQKTGLTPDKAQIAVTTVLDFLKKKLPAPIAAQVDAAMGSNSVAAAVGGLAGKK